MTKTADSLSRSKHSRIVHCGDVLTTRLHRTHAPVPLSTVRGRVRYQKSVLGNARLDFDWFCTGDSLPYDEENHNCGRDGAFRFRSIGHLDMLSFRHTSE